EAGVRAGEEAEHVHRMRVATRRLRAAERVFRPALSGRSVDETLDRARDDLRALAARLGAVRDRDVLIAGLRADAERCPEDAPAVERLIDDQLAARRAAHDELLAALDAGALEFLGGPFRAALADPSAPGGPPRERVRRRAPALVAERLRRLRRRGRRLRFATGAELHRLRIGAKRLRYTAELFQPAFPELEETIALATDLQDVLGRLHDDEVAVDALLGDLERVAGDPARAADGAALARLVARRRARRDETIERLQIIWRRLPSARGLRERLEGAGK
ncbi:MAG TPA: CHAD domain-containing protein, partial [Chloroflexota bacterium]